WGSRPTNFGRCSASANSSARTKRRRPMIAGTRTERESDMTNYVVAQPDEITVSENSGTTPVFGSTANDYVVLDYQDDGWISGISPPSYFTYAGSNLAFGETVLAAQLSYTVYAGINDYFWNGHYYVYGGSYTVYAGSYTSVYVVGVNDVPTGNVTVSGVPLLGETLTAFNSLFDPD